MGRANSQQILSPGVCTDWHGTARPYPLPAVLPCAAAAHPAGLQSVQFFVFLIVLLVAVFLFIGGNTYNIVKLFF